MAGLKQLEENLKALRARGFLVDPPAGYDAFPLLLRDPNAEVVVQGAISDIEIKPGDYFSKNDEAGEQRFFQIQKNGDGGFKAAPVDDLEDGTQYTDLDRVGTDFIVPISDTVTNAPAGLSPGDYVVGHFELGESPRAFQIQSGSNGTYDIERVDIDDAINALNNGENVTNLQDFPEENFTFYDDSAFEQFRFEFNDDEQGQLTPAREIPELTSSNANVNVAAFRVQNESGDIDQYFLVHNDEGDGFVALPQADFVALVKENPELGGDTQWLTKEPLTHEDLTRLPEVLGVEVSGLGADGLFTAAPEVQSVAPKMPEPPVIEEAAPVMPKRDPDPVIGGGEEVGIVRPDGDFRVTTEGRLPPELFNPEEPDVPEQEEAPEPAQGSVVDYLNGIDGIARVPDIGDRQLLQIEQALGRVIPDIASKIEDGSIEAGRVDEVIEHIAALEAGMLEKIEAAQDAETLGPIDFPETIGYAEMLRDGFDLGAFKAARDARQIAGSTIAARESFEAREAAADNVAPAPVEEPLAEPFELKGTLETEDRLEFEGTFETEEPLEFEGTLETEEPLEFKGAFETKESLALEGTIPLDGEFSGVQYRGGDIREWLKEKHSIVLPEAPERSDVTMTNAFQAQVARAAQEISLRAEAGEIDPAAQYEIVAAFGPLDAAFGDHSYAEHINKAFDGAVRGGDNLNDVMKIQEDRLNDFVMPAEAAARATANPSADVEYNR